MRTTEVLVAIDIRAKSRASEKTVPAGTQRILTRRARNIPTGMDPHVYWLASLLRMGLLLFFRDKRQFRHNHLKRHVTDRSVGRRVGMDRTRAEACVYTPKGIYV